MFEIILGYAVVALHAALLVALLAVLIFMFVRRRNFGFLWLGIGTVLWPVFSKIATRVVVHGAIASPPASWFPATWLQQHQISVGYVFQVMYHLEEIVTLVLIFVAVLYLWRRTTSNTVQAS